MILLQTELELVPFNELGGLGEWSLALVIALYLAYDLINKRLLKKNNNNIFTLITKRLEDQAKINTEIVSYFKIQAQRYSEELTDDQYKIFISRFLETTNYKINNFTRQIVEQNHLKGNEKKTHVKIHEYIKSLYESDEIELKAFKLNGIRISEFMIFDWIKDISDIILDHLYNSINEVDKLKNAQYSVTQRFKIIQNHFLSKLEYKII